MYSIGSCAMSLSGQAKSTLEKPNQCAIQTRIRYDLSHANDELIQGLHWLLARQDLAAFEKLYPIVRRITDLIVVILEGAFPEMSHVSAALNRFSDEINERMSKASTLDQIEQLSREVDALVSDHQKLVDEVTAEVVRLEERGRKQ
jgi:hypothetical protein